MILEPQNLADKDLSVHGLTDLGDVFWNLPPAQLVEHALKRGEGVLAKDGPLIVHTGEYTGRSPKDKYIVKEPSSEHNIWWGDVNQPVSQSDYQTLYEAMIAYAKGKDMYVFEGYAGADDAYQLPVRIITEFAWHSQFAGNMFIQAESVEELEDHNPEFTVIDMPGCKAPAGLGLNSDTFIVVNFAQQVVLIGGTEYAGEIKKSIFSALNYYLPLDGVMAMHCSANYGETKDNAALFFGLSGTGKTTLSNDPHRPLVGDDEHGWSDDGVFNFEGGSYAKVINLDREGEPAIYAATKLFGTIIENVVYDKATREIDFTDAHYTQNTRASYSLTSLDNVDLGGTCGHPKNIIFLTADAFGILPPISRLTKPQAMYHFLSGYTAKVAGTERGVTEPKPEFSACFGAPFLPLHPGKYAELLGQKIDAHKTTVWLVNTGWTGGPYGIGSRIQLAHTRAMITAALSGELETADFVTEPHFRLTIPTSISNVPDEVLNPRDTWINGKEYDQKAAELVNLFQANFKIFEDGVIKEIRQAGPQ